MIRQFARRWKCGKGSSLFAKFVRIGSSDESGAAWRRRVWPPSEKSVAILSQTAGKCRRAKARDSPSIIALKARATALRAFWELDKTRFRSIY